MTLPTELAAFGAEVIARVTAMQELMIPGTKAGGYASFEEPYGNFYWTNRLESIPEPVTVGSGVNEWIVSFPIVMRLHTGWSTKGFPGDDEMLIQWTYTPTIMEYFIARRDLCYLAGQAKIKWWDDTTGVISNTTGLTLFNKEDNPTMTMLGTEFRITPKAKIQIKRTV